MGNDLKRPDWTPVTTGTHRRVLRAGIFWRIVGTILAVLILVIVVYLYLHRTGR